MANDNLGLQRAVTPSDSEQVFFNFIFINSDTTGQAIAWETADGNQYSLSVPPLKQFIPAGEGVKLLSTGTGTFAAGEIQVV